MNRQQVHRALDAVAKDDLSVLKWIALLAGIYALYRQHADTVGPETYDLNAYRPPRKAFDAEGAWSDIYKWRPNEPTPVMAANGVVIGTITKEGQDFAAARRDPGGTVYKKFYSYAAAERWVRA